MRTSLLYLVFLGWFCRGAFAAETVKIVHFLSEDCGPLRGLEAVADAYSQLVQDEEVAFDFQALSMEEYARMLERLSSPDAPDMIQCFSDHAKDYGARLGQLMRLTAYLERENRFDPGRAWGDRFEASILKDSRDAVYGDLWSVPFASATERIFVNLDLLRECGLSLPKDWSSMLRCHEVLAEKGYTPCVMVGTPGPGPSEWVLGDLQAMLWQNKVDEWDTRNRDGRVDRIELAVAALEGTFSLDDPELLEPLRLLNGWARHWQEGYEEERPHTGLERFAQGDTGFYLDSMIRWWEILDKVKLAFRVAAMPLPSLDAASSPFVDGRYYEPNKAPGLVLAVPASVEGQRDRLVRVMDFLQFLTSRRGQEILVGEGFILPAVSGVQLPPEFDGFRRRIVGGFPIPNPFLLSSEGRGRWLEEGIRQDLLTTDWDPAKVRDKISPLLLAQARALLPAELQAVQRQLAYHRGAYALLEIRFRAADRNQDEIVAGLIEDAMRRSWYRLELKQDLWGYLKRASDRLTEREGGPNAADQ